MYSVVAIDPGFKNFAFVEILAARPKKPNIWKNIQLLKPPYTIERVSKAIYDWVTSDPIKLMLDLASVIVLEHQKTRKFDVIVNCIRFRYWEKTKVIHPNTIKSLYNLPSDRKEKKKATVLLVTGNVILPIKKGKKDDLCDAYLLALSEFKDEIEDFKKEWILK